MERHRPAKRKETKVLRVILEILVEVTTNCCKLAIIQTHPKHQMVKMKDHRVSYCYQLEKIKLY